MLFLAEGALVAVAGCLAGAALALVARTLLNNSGIILPPPPGVTHGMPLHVKFYGAAYASGALTMIATMALASYFPARRAAKMSIVEALTHV
jgi:putative ABC transport system permease protein